MKDTARVFYEVIACNESGGAHTSLGIGRDFQAMIYRDGLSSEQRAQGWRIEIKERKDLGPVPGTRSRGRSRRTRNRRMSKR